MKPFEVSVNDFGEYLKLISIPSVYVSKEYDSYMRATCRKMHDVLRVENIISEAFVGPR